MVVRLRLGRGPRVKRAGKSDRAALALAALLTPGVVMACALAFWRLGADLGITGSFAIRDGLFSHWQVWFALAAVLEFAAVVLSRYGHRTTHPDPSMEDAGSPLTADRAVGSAGRR